MSLNHAIDMDAIAATMMRMQKDAAKIEAADPDIVYEGSKVTLPDDPRMTLRKAREFLDRKIEASEQVVTVLEIIDGHPDDALVALWAAIREVYGWGASKGVEGFFGTTPPSLMSIRTGVGPNDIVKVPDGDIELPNIDGDIGIDRGTNPDTNLPAIRIRGSVKQRDFAQIENLANVTRRILATNSIYKGKAISLHTDRNGKLTARRSPTFMDLSNVRVEDLVLNPTEGFMFERRMLAPLQHLDTFRKRELSRRLTFLLAGSYGVGKTMLARTMAKVAQDNGWTFINLPDVRGLQAALALAKQYQPAVVFAEDADFVLSSRDADTNNLTTMIDGLVGQDDEIITVLTSNKVDDIDRAFLRSGRTNDVVYIRPPEPAQVERLIRLYARDDLAADSDLGPVGKRLSGFIPAAIMDIVEGARSAVAHLPDPAISPKDLIYIADGKRVQLELMQEDKASPSVGDRLAAALAETIVDGIEAFKAKKDAEEDDDDCPTC